MTPCNDRYCTEMIMDPTGMKRRCKIKIKKKNDICHIHKKIKMDKKEKSIELVYDIDYLDRTFGHNLMNLYDSWSEINPNEYVELDNEMWPVNIIINTITHQLNNSNMENPYLIYPNNPFTRASFTPNALLKLAEKIRNINTPINVVLKLLLEQSEQSIIRYYNESLHYLDRHSILLMSMICNSLRFMTINYKNSQNNYVGFWVRKNKKKTEFETLYANYTEAPYQIINRGIIINNPYREYLKFTLKNYPIDESQPTDIVYCEHLLTI
ncbi:hypothetical protein Indivirus_1_84 [Indivirus ILV1]|uniref:Uncharacterized protein n=1 Tax=Indivirus ILV1 TaxID=1977633 RepID=A0A1V0SCP3_9VIRU|nr:hypothetical protein Indivirus_1_84 [Indivirus ILV1]